MKKKSFLRTFARISVVLVVFAILGFTQDLRQLFGLLSRLSLFSVFTATLLFVFAGLLIGFRWFLLLRSQGIEITFGAATKVNFLGLFYNNFLFSSIGGDLLRGWYITHHTQKRIEAAFSVIVDRLIGFFAMILMVGVMALVISLDFGGVNATEAVGSEEGFFGKIMDFLLIYRKEILVLMILFILTFGAFFFIPSVRLKFSLIWSKIKQGKEKIFSAIKLYIKNPFVFAISVLISLLSQCLTIVAVFSMAKCIGIEIPLKYYFLIFPLGWVVSSVPITPGGVGIFELGLAAMFSLVPGVTNEQGLTLALCQRVIFLAGSLPGAFVHMTGLHLPKDKGEFSID